WRHPPETRVVDGDQALTDAGERRVDVVIMHSAGVAIGLRVDEMLGSRDTVIKSLSENFTDIQGLSGASILGDGSVCLMLDVGAVVAMATRSSRAPTLEEMAT
ncbi:MAG: chemotaxis protein CheW, partial [Planctomycetota bacterium]